MDDNHEPMIKEEDDKEEEDDADVENNQFLWGYNQRSKHTTNYKFLTSAKKNTTLKGGRRNRTRKRSRM